MHLSEIWRYPVKSMGGERLEHATLGPLGLHGDRIVQVYDGRGRLVTARTHAGLLGLRATLGTDGEPLVDGLPWTAPDVQASVERIVGPGARLVRNEHEARFDVLPLLVATDGAIAAFGRDARRLRPNLIVGGVDGLDERGWEGRVLRIDSVQIALADLRGRCVMTTVDPDTLARDPRVLKDIVRRFDGRLALNAGVLQGGTLRARAVELLGEPSCTACCRMSACVRSLFFTAVAAALSVNAGQAQAPTAPASTTPAATPPLRPNPRAPLYRHVGEQYRVYDFPGTGESIPYRLFVPSRWTPATSSRCSSRCAPAPA